MRSRVLAVALAALPFGASAAEETTLSEVIVRGRPLQPASDVSAVGDDAVGLLTSRPGVSAYSGGGVSSLPVINGLADDRVKLQVDGMEFTSACGNHMNPAASYIDPTKVGSLRVMAGITPVSAGGDSIAGTIAIDSRSPLFAATADSLRKEGSASLSTRSVDSSLTASLAGAIASDRFSLGYDGSIAHADSYKDGNGKTVLDTLYESRNQTVTLAAQGEGNLWVLRVGEQEIPYQGFPGQYMDMTGNHGVFANLAYGGEFAWGHLDARLYWQDTRHKMGFFSPEKIGSMPMDTHGRDMGYTVKAELPLQGDDRLRIGHEFHHTTLDDWCPPVGTGMMAPNTYVNINNGQRDRFVLFGEIEKRLTSRWTSLLGVRFESVHMDAGTVQDYNAMTAANVTAIAAFNGRSRDKRDNNWDLTALFRYNASTEADYEFGYARKTRSPNLYERYSWGRSTMDMTMIGWFGDGNGYVGNIDLKPEVAHTFSATADWHDSDRQQWNLQATPFYTYVQDYIDADRIGSFTRYGRTLSLLKFANHDAHLYGLNLSGQVALWDTASLGSGTLRGKLDWTRGKRNDGGDLYHIMPVNLRLNLEQQIGTWTHTAELQLVAAKTAVDSQRNEDKTGGYALANLGTQYRLSGGMTLTAGIRNLFDRQYALPLGGVNIAEAKASGATLAPLVGSGRSIDLGVNVKF